MQLESYIYFEKAAKTHSNDEESEWVEWIWEERKKELKGLLLLCTKKSDIHKWKCVFWYAACGMTNDYGMVGHGSVEWERERLCDIRFGARQMWKKMLKRAKCRNLWFAPYRVCMNDFSMLAGAFFLVLMTCWTHEGEIKVCEYDDGLDLIARRWFQWISIVFIVVLQMRYTKKVSMWPVGLIGKFGVSTPIVKNGTISGFYDGWIGGRKFPVSIVALMN